MKGVNENMAKIPTYKSFLKTGAALVVSLGLMAQIAPTPAQAGKTGAILFGAGVVTGVIVHEAIRNHHRRYRPHARPPRHRPRHYVRRPAPGYYIGYEEAVRIQTALNTLGYDVGTVDGVIGRGTMAAIGAFQADLEDPVTGVLTEEQKIVLFDRVERADSGDSEVLANNTADETQSPGDDAGPQDVLSIQNALNTLGYDAGAPDGVIGERTREAIMAFQTDINRTATGVLTEEERGILFDDASDIVDGDEDTETGATDDEDDDEDIADLDDEDEVDEDETDVLDTLAADEAGGKV